MPYEIGSHFEWNSELENRNKAQLDWLPNLGDSTFTFSGRSAIELALKDIKQTREVRTVYMPSYSCDSMINPFKENGLEIIFYDVTYDAEVGLMYDIAPEVDVDIFFAMSYFGLGEFQQNAVIEQFRARGKIIIEDITHRLLQADSYSDLSHYAIASLRKWFAIPTGGYVTKRDGSFFEKPTKTSDAFVQEKLQAMQAKQEYLQGEDVNKQTFLEQYANFEKQLKTVDSTYQIDETSLRLLKRTDIASIKQQRRSNAEVLYKGIKQYDILKPLIPNPNMTKACPLFVPIMLPTTEVRNDLRKYLIDHQIYCPVHWPQQKPVNTIWETELSLICDQRYRKADMHHILSVIDQWFQQ